MVQANLIFKHIREKDNKVEDLLLRCVSSQLNKDLKVSHDIEELAKDKNEIITSAN